MDALPFDKLGRFYRGNLHTHSNRSDGGKSPGEVVNSYRCRGYDFLSLTDHFLPASRFGRPEDGFVGVTDTRDLNSEGFVTIPGAELHGPGLENGDIWHILAVGLPIDFAECSESETGLELATRAAASGAFVGMAHPFWSGLSESDALSLVNVIDAVEVFNQASEMAVSRGNSWHIAEMLLAKGHRVSAYAADDAHLKHVRGTYVDAFGGWVQVRSQDLSPESLLSALKAGHYYSSTGPEFHDVALDNSKVFIRSSPVDQIYVTGIGSKSKRIYGRSLVSGEIALDELVNSPYIRVTIVNAFGQSAWTNPIWLT